jgi:hypothetical protein
MTRSLGLLMVLVSLAVGGYLFAQQSKTVAPDAQAQQAETQAAVAASATNFASAGPTLQLWFQDNGTYAGATLPPPSAWSSRGPTRPRTAWRPAGCTRSARAARPSPAPVDVTRRVFAPYKEA